MKILVSAGEASGDRYAAEVVEQLRRRIPNAEFFGCAGPRLRAAGVRAVVPSEDLAVVGLVEVLSHAPRIYQDLWKLVREAKAERPDMALLTDAPGFHLDLAKRLHRAGIPVFYFVAPQVWAWRKGRIRSIRKFVDHMLCIFPFEEDFFRQHQVPVTYVGHPLSGSVGATLSRSGFHARYGLRADRPLIALLPGSRKAEAARHLPALLGAAERLGSWREMNFVLPVSSTTGKAFFSERIDNSSVLIVEEDLHNAVANADLALVASGTATVETALLGTPMVTFYRVAALSWLIGKFLVDVPFYSMVNLLAGRRIVSELIQDDCTAEKLAAEAKRLLSDGDALQRMRRELSGLAEILRGDTPAAQRVAEVICEKLQWSSNAASTSSASLAAS